jgi:hypothetical protein
MATNNLLTQPTPHYHKFVDNQVLTDDQLNSVLDYLNHQDRLSRMLLHGVGVVCGLQISLNESSREILLSDGVAVTTAGDLIKPVSQKYIGFKRFKDSNVKYSFFTDEEGATIDLWELETDTSPSDVQPLSQFESTTDIDFKKAVALIYLEDYLGEEEDCSPVDCDTQGRPVVNQLRVLLVSPENAQWIAEQDSIFSKLLRGGVDPFVNELSKVYVPRVMLNPANTKSFDQFKKAYEISFNSLAEQISRLGSVSIFERTFNQGGIDPISELRNVVSSALNFQYVYDFYRDLSDTYNRLRDLLKKNYAICCPDPTAFPKHVLLGNLISVEKVWRHPFYPSPTHVETEVGAMNKVFKRLLNLIKHFQANEKNEIRITPSRDDDFSLGRRAVPFYYNLEKAENVSTFLQEWKEEDVELVPNYYGSGYPGGGFNPLNVHLDDHDFYRIEGHTGKHIQDAHKKIKEIQAGKSLPFDIQQVAVGSYPDESTIDYDKYRVYFEDLQVVLQAWNEEQQCLMKTASDFLTKFSTKDPGRHIDYKVSEQDLNTDSNNNLTSNEATQPFAKMTEYYAYGTVGSAKKKQAKENQVMKSIASEKDTLGYAMKDVVKITDNRNDFWVKTNNAVGNIITNWEPDIVEATINIPGQLVGYLKETEDYKLTDIEDFTEENLKKYLESLKAQCRKTSESKKKLQTLINKESSVLKSKDWTENYMYVLNRISSSCCIIEKVKVLYEKIIERKKEVLEKYVLNTFIQDHPGAEHKAGVERGGTFVLLYYSASREKTASVEEIRKRLAMTSEPGMRDQPYLEFPVRREFGDVTHFPGTFDDAEALRRAAEEGMSNIPGFRGRSIPARENIPHGTVIGDLCLPYICCSGTPSTTFVFPEQLATLRIPVDHVCVDENGNTDPIPLNVTPPDGAVKAFIQNRELGNVIRVQENGTFFEPNNVSAEDFGKPIRFEVNGQPVEPILEINRKPNPRFTVGENISFKERNTIAVVTFQNRSEPFDELSFEWDFDGEIKRDENAIEFTHSFKVQPGENFDFEVKLTAFSGSCQATFTESVNIDVPELDIPDEPDQPDDPDQPDNPDQPDQPERNCIEISTSAIKASFNIIEREARENRREIDRQFLQFYSRRIKPAYELILEDPQSALNGQIDNRIIPLIQEAQKMVIESIHGQNTAMQQEFMLKIYYEMALLYFYINSCRDSRIDSNIAIHDRQMNWLTFTEISFERFREAMKLLLEVDKINAKFEAIQDRMGARFDRELSRLIEKIISILNRVADGR